jgi:hypothetical protein
MTALLAAWGLQWTGPVSTRCRATYLGSSSSAFSRSFSTAYLSSDTTTGSVQRADVSSTLSAIDFKNKAILSIALRLREIGLKRKARCAKVSIETP